MFSATHPSVQAESAPPSGRVGHKALRHISSVDAGRCSRSCMCHRTISSGRSCNLAAHTPSELPLTALPPYGFGQCALVVRQLLQRRPGVHPPFIELASWQRCTYTVCKGVARPSAGVAKLCGRQRALRHSRPAGIQSRCVGRASPARHGRGSLPADDDARTHERIMGDRQRVRLIESCEAEGEG